MIGLETKLTVFSFICLVSPGPTLPHNLYNMLGHDMFPIQRQNHVPEPFYLKRT